MVATCMANDAARNRLGLIYSCIYVYNGVFSAEVNVYVLLRLT